MGQIDEGANSPGAEDKQDGQQDKFVSVQEAIKYRKRAQGAERRSEELAAELAEARGQVDKLCGELGAIKVEQKLLRKLTEAGAVDLEAGVLLAKGRVEGDGFPTGSGLSTSSDEHIDRAIEQLKKDKPYLFGSSGLGHPLREKASGSGNKAGFGTAAVRGTAVGLATPYGGAKERGAGSGVVLERAAKRAAQTGDRKDLQEYLRVRRNFL